MCSSDCPQCNATLLTDLCGHMVTQKCIQCGWEQVSLICPADEIKELSRDLSHIERTLKIPAQTYRVFDATDTGDLVLWSDFRKQADFSQNRKLQSQVDQCLNGALYFHGPVNSQQEWCPGGVESLKLPVHCHFFLEKNRQFKMFLFLTQTQLEIHIPELWFVTTNPVKDRLRLIKIQKMISCLAAAFEINWQSAEYDGFKPVSYGSDLFWIEYLNNLFSRIDYQESTA
ncbi:hypothetical protein [Gimesia sp.]|uniref:hypothetical protein n=1 Tax=Gimesia sp. TaxID=2024833 RepID=UPI003A93F223